MFIYAEVPEGADEQRKMARVRRGMEIIAACYGLGNSPITVGVAHGELPGMTSWAWAHLDETGLDRFEGNVIDLRDYLRTSEAPGAA